MDVNPGGDSTVKVEQAAPSSYPFTYNFDSGTSVTVEAVPASGYLFKNWGGDLSGTDNPTTIVLDCDKSITANFSQISDNQVSWPLVGVVIGVWVLVVVLVIVLIIIRRRLS